MQRIATRARIPQTRADEMREKLFTIRMNDEETRRLERIATHYGVTAAAVIRMLLKREERALSDELDADKPPKKPKPAK